MFGIIPALGFEMGTLTVAGVAFEVKNWKNLEISFNQAIKLGLISGIILTIVTFVFAPQITYIFTYSAGSAVLSERITSFIRILSLFFTAVPFGLISTAMFQGAGKGVTSLILNSIRDIGLKLLFSFILAIIFKLGEFEVYYGILLGIIIGSAINYLYFKYFLSKLKNKE